MPVLNEYLDFATVAPDVKRAFFRRQATKKLLHPGHLLYKFTQYGLYKPDGSVTPWWSSVDPIAPKDPGLKGSQRLAGNVGASDQHYARVRAAVTNQWNTMDKLQKARLTQPVYGFFGQCAGQLVDESPGMENVFQIGGAFQLWIPNLTRSHIVPA